MADSSAPHFHNRGKPNSHILRLSAGLLLLLVFALAPVCGGNTPFCTEALSVSSISLLNLPLSRHKLHDRGGTYSIAQ